MEGKMKELPQKYDNRQVVKKIISDDELQPGDVVGIHRMGGLYDHYGIYTGNGGMIHYADPSGDFGANIVVHRTTLEKFKEGSDTIFTIDFDKYLKNRQVKLFDILTPVRIDFIKLLELLFSSNDYHLYSPEETVARAESRLGEKSYNIATNNCEHFAIWCKTGLNESTQVKNLLEAIGNIVRFK